MLFKKILIIGIILLFLGTCITPTFAIDNIKKSFISIYDGNTLYVGGSGPNNYTRIQDAIDNATDGDTIYVYDDSSPYYENVEIMYKSINLIGEDKNTTVIDGDESGDVVSVLANWVNISGFTIQNSKIDYRHAGFIIWYSNHIIITGNIISNNDNGINLWYSSDYNTIKGNIISDNWDGIELYESCNHNIITGNNILNNDARGIRLLNSCGNNIITGNNITNNEWYDIVLGYSSDNTITGNYISSSDGTGIDLYNSSNNKITGNTISNNEMSIYLNDDCDYNTIKDNTISNSRYEGIKLSGSSNNVTGNIISNNRFGINLYKSYSSNISSNNIILNSDYGIRLGSYCFMNIISGNNISNNDDGIIVCDSNNTIYHNNLINNTQNANDTGNNTWDSGYPSGGNYWDDYNGTDADGDGIGDIPYLIPGGDNEDRYPLGNFVPTSPKIVGPTKCKPDIDYDYTFVATDPDGDEIWYHIGWGDKEIIYIYGPYPSGEEITLSYNWTDKGTYTITCWARDIYDAMSIASTLEINVPRNRTTFNIFLIQLFERFPLLERLLSFLLL